MLLLLSLVLYVVCSGKLLGTISFQVEVDEDPAESKKDEENEKTEVQKKKTKTVVEKYWDWELANETQPIWVSLNSFFFVCLLCFLWQ